MPDEVREPDEARAVSIPRGRATCWSSVGLSSQLPFARLF